MLQPEVHVGEGGGERVVRGQQKQLHVDCGKETSKSISISFSAVFHSCTSVDFVSFLISLIVLHSSTIIFYAFVP